MARILIIDDDSIVRQLVADCLKLEHEVLTAQNGVMGIDVAKSHPPDLVICDINMPHMDGFEVLHHFQNIDQMADTPFIFLSGSGDASTIRNGMILGADDFLTKPFSVEELLHVVRNRLQKRARRQALITKAIDELRLNITTALPHELRTAIAIMEGYAYLVLEDAEKMDPVQRDMIEGIRINAVRLRSMAEKYLWYLKVYLPGEVDTYSLMDYPDRVLEHKAFEIAQRFNRASDLNLYLETGQVQIGDEYLSKIAEEVIENAFKFSNPGTSVSIWGMVEAQEYRLTVCNYGRAMTPEQIKQIGGFMQFDRAQYEQQGTGLGLIIAKRLVEISGGQLSVNSLQGETTITISLPGVNMSRESLTELQSIVEG